MLKAKAKKVLPPEIGYAKRQNIVKKSIAQSIIFYCRHSYVVVLVESHNSAKLKMSPKSN